MQLPECSVCKQAKADIQNYRDDLDIEPQLLVAYPYLRDLEETEVR